MLKSKELTEIERSIIKNFLDIIILGRLRSLSPLGGYDIFEFLQKKFDILISSGTVYSVLYSMERKGLIKGETIEGKRKYILTERGSKVINELAGSKDEIQRFMKSLFEV
jgi:DNA-binding PadR family transcriptional regulator